VKCLHFLMIIMDSFLGQHNPSNYFALTLEGDDTKYTQQYIEKLLGRPFSYIEFLNENFTAELKERAKPDFIKICRNATDD